MQTSSKTAISYKFSKKTLEKACLYQVLVPKGENYTPPSRTPWGGKEILCQMKEGRLVGPAKKENPVLGESWEISGHPSFPNWFFLDEEEVSVAAFEELVGNLLYGKSTQNGKMPFLLKLLNTGSWTLYRTQLQELLGQYDAIALSAAWTEVLGVSCLSRLLDHNNDVLHRRLVLLCRLLDQKACPSSLVALKEPLRELHQQMLEKNLSVQVHPLRGSKGSKSEAWVILDAEPGAGVYLGLKEGVMKEDFEAALQNREDMSRFLQFVEVQRGDAFFLPSGTPHAIGAGVLLFEAQESSEATYRLYDWNRVVDGKPRPLHEKEALDNINFSEVQGGALQEKLGCRSCRVTGGANGSATVESLVEEKEFSLQRIAFGEEGDEYLHEKRFAGLTLIKGRVRVFIPGQEAVYTFRKGESFILPAALEEAVITGCETASVLLKVF